MNIQRDPFASLKPETNGETYDWQPSPPNEAYAAEFTGCKTALLKPLNFQPWGNRDLTQIRQPEFVYSDFYARGYTSLTVAPPKVGKSMLGLAEALDMASGAGFLTGHRREPLRVLYYNAEDDLSVLEGRVAALLCHYRIQQTTIAGTLYPVSGVDADDFYMVSGQEGAINETLFTALEQFIEEQRIDVLIFDPLQDLSRSPETNEVFRLLGQRLRRLASSKQVALGLIHHTRKLTAGVTASIDDARGGSALRGTARFNRLLLPMSEAEGAKAGIENHRHFMRIGDMESNLAPPSADVNRWFQKVSVETPNGDRVGAVEPWVWPDAFEGVSNADAIRVQALVEKATPPARYDSQAKYWVGHIIADVLGIDLNDKSERSRVKSIIATWIRNEVLTIEEEDDKAKGRLIKIVARGPNTPHTEVHGE